MVLKEHAITTKRTYTLKEVNTKCDNSENIIRTREECEKALTKVGKSPHIAWVGGPWGHVPAGCTYNPSHSHFNNNNSPGNAHPQMAPVCVTEKPFVLSCAGDTCTMDECCGKQATYEMLEKNTVCASKAQELKTKEECHKALAELGLPTTIPNVGNWDIVPSGCQYRPVGQAHWNNGPNGKARGDMSPICLKSVAKEQVKKV
jgi:hypothetical protein